MIDDSIFDKNSMQELQNILRENKKTLTCAESCTGGLVASMITEISGSSDIFNGSVVSYSNDIKEKILKVKTKNLKNFGAVSVQVVSNMLDGVMELFCADYSIAISGVAGPNGGTETKPVGRVIIGIASKNGYKEVIEYDFKGNRNEIQKKSANVSLKNLFNLIKKDLTV